MQNPDRRNEFKYVQWQQGELLLTQTTKRWSEEQREEADAIERTMAFVRFHSHDEVRSRELVCKYQNAEECAAAVAKHNAELNQLKGKVSDMRDWAQWFINHNMRYLVLAIYLPSIPFAAIWYVSVAAVREAISEAGEIPRMVNCDIKTILSAKKDK